jgi:voltage-gated potassium channel
MSDGAGLRARIIYKAERVRQRMAMRPLGMVLLVNLVVIILVGSMVLLVFEKKTNPLIDTYGDAIWCTVITIATVGYGDKVPITAGGKLTVVLMIIFGIGALTAYISSRSAQRVQKLQRRAYELDGIVKSRGHFVVCGWNERGKYLLETLKQELEKGKTAVTLLCDLPETPVEDGYTVFLRGSAANERDLQRANIEQAKAVILLADETGGGAASDADARAVLAALTIRSLNPDVPITAEVRDPENISHMMLAGVGEILDSDMLLGKLMARSALHFGLIGMVSEMVSKGAGEKVYHLPVDEKMAGLKPGDLITYVRNEYDATLLGVRSAEKTILMGEVSSVSVGDILVLLSKADPREPQA